jgi:hypothetical protein
MKPTTKGHLCHDCKTNLRTEAFLIYCAADQSFGDAGDIRTYCMPCASQRLNRWAAATGQTEANVVRLDLEDGKAVNGIVTIVNMDSYDDEVSKLMNTLTNEELS